MIDTSIDSRYIKYLTRNKLEQHPLLAGDVIQTIDDVRILMEMHVFAVWDFMSLAKALQHIACPSGGVWVPNPHIRKIGRLINEIILAEETDEVPQAHDPLDFNLPAKKQYMSHFELYLEAMKEIGADTSKIDNFINTLQTTKTRSLNQCLLDIPAPSRDFCNSTFEIIATGEPHIIASAFAFGREKIVPVMFQRIIEQLDKGQIRAELLRFYLKQHIALDTDSHGPAAVKLVVHLCDEDHEKWKQAVSTAETSINARAKFWTAVQKVIETVRKVKQEGAND